MLPSPSYHAKTLQVIAAKLHGSAIEAFGAGTGHPSDSGTATVFQPGYACFAAVFGRKPMIVLALVFFTTGTSIAAVADDFTVLRAGRTVQSVGAGGLTTIMTGIMVTDLVGNGFGSSAWLSPLVLV
jgi:predicted MFS family arabinose efflux permease